MAETFDWLKPSLLWQADGLDFRQPDFFRPHLLGFHSDTFMEDFLAAATAPRPTAFQRALTVPPQANSTLKLFQPMHGWFYLVSASLCCRLPGFPDREIRVADGEQVSFVLRKLVSGAEYAWGVKEGQPGWQLLNGQPKRFMPGEERHPLLTTTAGNGRNLLFGYLPVASRETYNAPPAALAVDATPDIRLAELDARFIDSLTPPDAQTPSIIDATDNSVALTVSVYLLLDLWEYFETHLKEVAIALRDNPIATLSGEKAAAMAALITFLKNQALGYSLTLGRAVTLAEALGAVAKQREALNQPGGGNLAQLDDYNLKGLSLNTSGLRQAVQNALPTAQPTVEVPKFEPRADAQYVLRCVYERPQCDPPIAIVSQPSVPFQLAPFFDPEAPARPVRIPLPADVSIAGLRKLKKNVAFMMSDAMRKKAARITGKEQELIQEKTPGLNDEPTDELAHICSFSIQIIFIVAFFLLITFVVILNFVFWWIAFFKICLPIPKRFLPEG